MPPLSTDRSSSRPRMLVCDLDGTVLNRAGVITAATAAAFNQALEAGIEIVLATGRRHSYAEKVLEPAMFDRETTLISSNGAITCNLTGERMHRIGMPVAMALDICTQLTEFRGSLVFTFERIGFGSLVVEDIAELHRRLPRWVDANAHEIECFVPLERAFDSGEEPIQAMICGTPPEMLQAIDMLHSSKPEMVHLRDSISVQKTEYILRDLCVLDLLPAGCSKGKALARLAAQRGINPAEIACIGDNMNDADMLAFAGQAIVMGNAHADLLAMARANGWKVTGSNEEDGVAQAILRMLGTLPQSPSLEGQAMDSASALSQ